MHNKTKTLIYNRQITCTLFSNVKRKCFWKNKKLYRRNINESYAKKLCICCNGGVVICFSQRLANKKIVIQTMTKHCHIQKLQKRQIEHFFTSFIETSFMNNFEINAESYLQLNRFVCLLLSRQNHKFHLQAFQLFDISASRSNVFLYDVIW